MSEFQILDYDRKMQGIMRKAEVRLSAENLSTIKKYDAEMATLGLKKSTRVKQISLIVDMSIRIGKDWKEVKKEDIDGLIRNVIDEFGDNLGGETETTRDYKKSLKPFFRWFKLGTRDFREAGDPPELKSIRMKNVKDKIIREELLTEEDHKKLLDASGSNSRDRALIDVHYEAGTRPGEILSLKIKHVKFDQFGATIHVDGKTGPRPVRIISSVPNLAKWLEIHPLRDDSDAPLWVLMDQDNYGQQLTYSGARAILQRLVRKAKIKKRVNLKLFRHSEATRLSKHLPEATMRQRHGWTKGSAMPSRYVHLVNADVDEKLFEMYGIKTKNEEMSLPLPRKCLICDVPNSPRSEKCYKCGKPLDLQRAVEMEEKAQENNFAINKLAGKVLIQMLKTGEIPKLSKNEMDLLVNGLNL